MSNHLWLQYPWGNCKFAVVDPIRLQCKFAVVDPIVGWINDNLGHMNHKIQLDE
jgi:hypothetical protein